MLKKVTPWRHVVVGVAALGLGLLGGVGIIGAGDQSLLRTEHFDAKQVVVAPAGPEHPDGVRIREIVDIDFGLTERRGYQRIVPHDFGEPVDVVASSPDANGELEIVDVGVESRIRIGNPAITFTGQHRYILEYTLPEAQVESGELAVDIIGHEETFVTDRFEVVVAGFDLSGTRCDVGDYGAFGGCELVPDGDLLYSVVIEPLDPGKGITVGGSISSLGVPTLPDAPPFPDRNPTGLRPIGLVLFAVAIATALVGFLRMRHVGSNVVYGGGGAADAAFGTLAVPSAGDPIADVATHRVADSQLADLATIEFVPPRGLEPWHGRVLLREEVDDDTVAAWFSEMVARGAITIDDSGDEEVLRRGDTSRLSGLDRRHVEALFRNGDEVELGAYSASFSAVWSGIAKGQGDFVRESGWWNPPLGGTPNLRAVVVGAVALIAFVGVVFGNADPERFRRFLGGFVLGPLGAVLITFLAMLLVTGAMYGVMRPSRTATGSALTLRTESFRRFLAASEGRHVDWAWEQGLIREYSAWAVALDAADAWSAAIEASNVPDPSIALRGPLLVHSHASSFSSAHTAPSSSGSGGGGGGSGGGGGGGSSGSW